jgi:hypothetical protein
MKIGIFGDSFADPGNEVRRTANYSWFNIFAKNLNKPCNIDFHGMGASSLFFSYQKFLKYYSNYDLIIFCVTGASRYPKSLTLSDGHLRHYCSLGAVDNAYKILGKNITDDDKRILKDLQGYFIMAVDEYNQTASDLMINHMITLHKNIIFYPNFPDSYTKQRFELEQIPEKYLLFEMYKKQLKMMNIDIHTDKEEKNTIVGHLVHEYNVFFGNLLYKKYLTGSWDFSGYDDIKTIQMPNEYYYNFK